MLEDILDFIFPLNFSTAFESLDKLSLSAGRMSTLVTSERGVEKTAYIKREISTESL